MAQHHTPLSFCSVPSRIMNVSPSPTITLSTRNMNNSVLSSFACFGGCFNVSRNNSVCLARYALSCRSAATALSFSSARRYFFSRSWYFSAKPSTVPRACRSTRLSISLAMALPSCSRRFRFSSVALLSSSSWIMASPGYHHLRFPGAQVSHDF